MSHNATPHASPAPHPTKHRPTSVTQAAQPTKVFFDPYNSSATGHQRAENRLSGSTSWRDSRNLKLASQFRSDGTGGERLYDTVGAGSENFGSDGRKENGGWERGASGLRPRGQRSIIEALRARTVKSNAGSTGGGGAAKVVQELDDARDDIRRSSEGAAAPAAADVRHPSVAGQEAMPDNTRPQIFANLTVYVNGSTAPVISDHKLKSLLVSHGARTSIALGRRTVTHVILGSTCAHGGAGGGLSGSKIQKEVSRTGGKGIKFVGPEWVVESVKAGKRLHEGRFQVLDLGGRGQRSVHGLFKGARQNESEPTEKG